MNSLKKVHGVPLLNFARGPGVRLLIFEGGSWGPTFNFRLVPDPSFNIWGGNSSSVPAPGVLVPLLHHATIQRWKKQGDINTLKKMHSCLVEAFAASFYHLIEPHSIDLQCKPNKFFLYEGNIGFELDLILFLWVKNITKT